jgi:DeoR family transcriptional regulator, fructose operon transcriptional repressor
VQGSIAAEERLRWIEDRLTIDGSVTIADAAGSLDVSEMTIRRDLAELEERGSARRVRGGATAVGPQPFAQRRHTAPRAKSQIAAKLAALVPAVGTVAFDASSTVMRLAGNLDHARDLTVLTNGPDTFAALQDLPGIAPLLTGGRLDARTGSLVGPLACRAAEQFSVDVFVTSAAALSEAGTLEAALEEAEVKRAIATGARRVVVAVDSSKLADTAVALALEWDRVDTLVTELDPADRRLDPYRTVTALH